MRKNNDDKKNSGKLKDMVLTSDIEETDDDFDMDIASFTMEELFSKRVDQLTSLGEKDFSENNAVIVDVPKKISQAKSTDKYEFAARLDHVILYGVRQKTTAELSLRQGIPVRINNNPAVISGREYISLGGIEDDSVMYVFFSCPSVYLRYEDSPREIPCKCEAVVDETTWHYLDAIEGIREKLEAIQTLARLTPGQFNHVVGLINRPAVDNPVDGHRYVPIQDIKTLTNIYKMCYHTYPVQKRAVIEALFDELKRTPSMKDSYIDIVTQLSYAITIDDCSSKTSPVKGSGEIWEVFEKYIYGMTDLKERIIEYIISMQYSGKGNLLILMEGPPGVGKTSIARAVAEVTDRLLVRVDFSGVDIVGIAGLVKSYGGAQPSKISKGVYLVGKTQVVLLLDELDKPLKSTKDGDTYAPLAKPLGPDHAFFDEFLGFDTNLDNAIVIATCNDMSQIPGYILNRFGGNVLRIPGYSWKEKTIIAKTHLIPDLLREYNIDSGELSFTDEALELIAADYCLDEGARELQSHLARIIRRVIVRWVDGKISKPFVVDCDFVEKFLPRKDKKTMGFA